MAAHSPLRGFSPPGPPTAPVIAGMSTLAMTGATGLASTAELARVTGEKPAPGGLPEHPLGGRVIRIPAGQCVG
ncbi:MAG: hypothetical protein ABR922_18375, partial [Streptosporangiaceae bacterium]